MISGPIEARPAPRITDAGEKVKEYILATLNADNKSAAHAFPHLYRVGTYAALIVKQFGGGEKEQEMARIGGYLHDFVRSATQTTDDEQRSVAKAAPMLKGLGVFSDDEVRIILESIKTDEVAKALLAGPEKDDPNFFTGERRVRVAVWVGDKCLEANGAYVMARRSQFVGAERFLHGDLKALKDRLTAEGSPLAEKLTPEMVVICESYIRLGVKNNKSMYPSWFLPVAEAQFAVQRQFYYALLRANDLLEGDVARFILETNFPGVTRADIEKWEAKRPNTDLEVLQANKGMIEGAQEIVYHFSSPDRIDIETSQAVRDWKPSTFYGTLWHGQMLEYLDGKMVGEIQKLRLTGVPKAVVAPIRRPVQPAQ